MRTKKEDVERHKIISVLGHLIETRFIPFADGTYAQELEVKTGKERIKMIFPFVKPHQFVKGEERRWNVIEKETVNVSYSIFQPDPNDKAKSQAVKALWKGAIETKISLIIKGAHSIEFSRKGFVPYERKAVRIKYYEIIGEGLDLSFFTTKVSKK